jgi:hypothetical protein
MERYSKRRNCFQIIALSACIYRWLLQTGPIVSFSYLHFTYVIVGSAAMARHIFATRNMSHFSPYCIAPTRPFLTIRTNELSQGSVGLCRVWRRPRHRSRHERGRALASSTRTDCSCLQKRHVGCEALVATPTLPYCYLLLLNGWSLDRLSFRSLTVPPNASLPLSMRRVPKTKISILPKSFVI